MTELIFLTSMTELTQIRRLTKWMRHQRSAKVIIILGVVFGLTYPVFGDGFGSIFPFINGFLIGLLGSLVICLFEYVLFSPPVRKITFYWLVIIKVLTYTASFILLILGVLLVSRSIEYGMTLNDTWNSPQFQHLLYEEDLSLIISYALALVALVIFVKEISRKLGPRVLINFIIGKYHHPRREDRIFLFVDLTNSAGLAEKLNDIDYHNLLNDFFHDITESIVYTHGEIYQYVGDEVVVSWPLEKGLHDLNCINAFHYAKKTITAQGSKYLRNYGVKPLFKASLHCGSIIHGEVGDLKCEIAFHGDVINTAARLERLCSKLNEELIISEVLYNLLPETVQYDFVPIGEFPLKGKKTAMNVYGLTKEKQTFQISNSGAVLADFSA